MSSQPVPEARPSLLTQYRFTWHIGFCRRCGEETAEGHIYGNVPVRPLCELCVYFQQVLRPPQYRNPYDSDTWSMSPFNPRLAEGPPQTEGHTVESVEFRCSGVGTQTTTVGTQTLSETRTKNTQTFIKGFGADQAEIAHRRWKIHPGDWFCETCGNCNFQFRDTCNNRNCRSPRVPEFRSSGVVTAVSVGTQTKFMKRRKKFKPGDWLCEACGTHNFHFRETCHNPDCPNLEFNVVTGDCEADPRVQRGDSRGAGPPGLELPYVKSTMGTQTVSVGTQTEFMRERKRPKFKPGDFKPGDWFCEACGNHNFHYREVCHNPHCPDQRVQNVVSRWGNT